MRDREGKTPDSSPTHEERNALYVSVGLVSIAALALLAAVIIAYMQITSGVSSHNAMVLNTALTVAGWIGGSAAFSAGISFVVYTVLRSRRPPSSDRS